MQNESEQPSLQNALPEYPLTLLDFQRMFPDETACLRYLEKIRWPDGFVCGKCATVGEPFRLSSHPRKLKCRSCQHLESVTADTFMHLTGVNYNYPLTTTIITHCRIA